MEQVIMNQLAFARNSTLKIVEDVNEVTADKIPTGFRNHIHWHLGHIYTVQEDLHSISPAYLCNCHRNFLSCSQAALHL